MKAMLTLLSALFVPAVGLYFLTTELLDPAPRWWMMIASCLMIIGGIGQLWRDVVRPWVRR